MIAAAARHAASTDGNAARATTMWSGNRMEAQRQLGDHAERALGADEEIRQVVAGRRLRRTRAGTDDAAVGEHDLEREHVRAHAAVAHGRRAARVRRGHPAERRVGARVDGEEQAVRPGGGLELRARHARLDGHGQILRTQRDDRVHPRQVEADPAVERNHVALEARAGAERDDGHAVLGRHRRARRRPPRSTRGRRRCRAAAAGDTRGRPSAGRAPSRRRSRAARRERSGGAARGDRRRRPRGKRTSASDDEAGCARAGPPRAREAFGAARGSTASRSAAAASSSMPSPWPTRIRAGSTVSSERGGVSRSSG